MPRRGPSRRGVSLIEIAVAIGFIAVLLAIVSVAVQRSREASRRLRCSNNLKQMGLAIQGYAQATGSLPASNSSRVFSIHVTLLPYMDQLGLYNSLNLTLGYSGGDAANSTVEGAPPASVLCPSDAGARAGYSSYAGNAGVGICRDGYYGCCDNGGIPLIVDRSIGVSAIRDGLSNTAAVSEWATGTARAVTVPRRYDEFVPFVATCGDAAVMSNLGVSKGTRWMWGDFGQTIYNHFMIPNERSCINYDSPMISAWTAGSGHGGGALVQFIDGHVGFIKDSVDAPVWRAIGTRAGAEVYAGDHY